MNELISVVIPLHSNFDTKRLNLTILFLQRQKGVHFEIIVSEGGENKSYKPINKNVIHIYTFMQTKDICNAKLRNIGIINSNGKYIYSLDADILLWDPCFLHELSKLSKSDCIYYRPSLRRLYRKDFKNFYEHCFNNGVENTIPFYTYNDFCIYLKKQLPPEMVHFSEYDVEQKYIRTYSYYFADKLRNKKKFERFPENFVLENRHCGSIFFFKDQFFSVGGYCEDLKYSEDRDLQYKFRMKYGIKLIPEKDNFKVIHLDHLRKYRYKNNDGQKKILISANSRKIIKRRQKLQLQEIIEKDKKCIDKRSKHH